MRLLAYTGGGRVTWAAVEGRRSRRLRRRLF